MRSLVILKGLVKRNKIDWVKREGLFNFLLDIDSVKKLYYRPDYRGGKDFLTRSYDDNVYRVFIQALCSRLSTGTLIVVDMDNESVSTVEELAIIYGYKVFYHVEPTPFDYVKKNKKYCTYQYVPQSEEMLKREVSEFNKLSFIEEDLINSYIDLEKYWRYQLQPIKVNNKDSILHVSDLHSHWEVLRRNIPIKKFPLIVFLGDYIDGPEEGGSRRLINFVLKNKDKESFVFLEGNHELRLRKYLGYIYLKGRGKKIVSEILRAELSEEFMQKTSHEFSDIKMIDAKEILLELNETLREFVMYERDNITFICTHAGLKWKEQLSPKYIGNVIYSTRNTERVDEAFSTRYSKCDLWSIHGHCKYNNINFTKFPRVVNIDTEDENKVNYYINRPGTKSEFYILNDKKHGKK